MYLPYIIYDCGVWTNDIFITASVFMSNCRIDMDTTENIHHGNRAGWKNTGGQE